MRGWITAGPGARDRVAWAPEICEILDNQTDHAIAGQCPKEQNETLDEWMGDRHNVCLGYRHHVGVAAKSDVNSATGTVEGPSSCSPTTASVPPSGGSTPVRPSCCWGRRLPFDSASKP